MLKIDKFGYIIKARVRSIEDVEQIFEILKDYYSSMGYDEIIIQMRQSGKGGGKNGWKEEDEES